MITAILCLHCILPLPEAGFPAAHPKLTDPSSELKVQRPAFIAKLLTRPDGTPCCTREGGQAHDHGSWQLTTGREAEDGYINSSPQHLPPAGIRVLRVGVSLHKSQRCYGHRCGWERTHSSHNSRSLQADSICTRSCLSLTLRHRSAADFK